MRVLESDHWCAEREVPAIQAACNSGTSRSKLARKALRDDANFGFGTLAMTGLRAGVKLAGFIAMTLPGLPVQRALIAISTKGARHFPHLYHRAVTRWLDIKVNIVG